MKGLDNQKKKTMKIGKYNIQIIELNEPSEEAIRNTNRKVNEIMNKMYSKPKFDKQQDE